MKRGLIAATVIIPTVAAVVVVVSIASGPRGCSLVGCDDGITVYFWKPVADTDRPLHVRFCAVGECEQARVSGRHIAVDLPCPEFDGEGTVSLTARVLGPNGDVQSIASKEINIRRFEPNGAECGPTCWVGSAAFSVRKSQFVPRDQAQEAISRRY